MAPDLNNPLEFHPTDAITLRDFATSPPDSVIDELLANGGQTLITRNGRFVAMIEPISQDERTQADLATRHSSFKLGPAVVESASKAALIDRLIQEAKQAADINRSAT